jgi:hypothetical protein
MTIKEAKKIVEDAGYSVEGNFPVEFKGATFHSINDVHHALLNNLISGRGWDDYDGVWGAIAILEKAGIDRDEAECIVGDWNGGVL